MNLTERDQMIKGLEVCREILYNSVLGKLSLMKCKQSPSIQKVKVNIANTKGIYFCDAEELKPETSICSTTDISPQLIGLVLL